ncbi:hypothetical protein B0H14DRAFT_2343800 [Mycena olivaceomarginata]|nr:hypothetical protein B0H14DRAFT_2343800 [Mycena olivaceomarginata]
MSKKTPLQKRTRQSLDTPSPLRQPTKRPKPAVDVNEKLQARLCIQPFHRVDWSLGDFLYHLFSHKDKDEQPLHRSPRHGIITQIFLSGRSTHSVSEILDTWLTSLDGRGYPDQILFDTMTPYAAAGADCVCCTLAAKKIRHEFLSTFGPNSGPNHMKQNAGMNFE